MHTRATPPGAALGVLLGSACSLVLFAGCAKRPESGTSIRIPAPDRLTIITPHNANIRETFEIGFSDWCQANRGSYIKIDWIVRGTPQCVDYIRRTFSRVDDNTAGPAPDLMFGGGIADHVLLAERDQSQRLNLSDALNRIPATVNGLPTRDADGRWYATGLSSFGIIYNVDICRQRGIAAPATWTDLGDPRFLGWAGIADPAASGSHRQAMMFILQSQGWEKGWATLIRILGNARALVGSSTDALDHVGNGVFLAGFAVNFDGLARVDEADGTLAYVNPPGATAVTPDVTSVLRTARNVTLAEDFVRYCLSEAGQVAWGVKAEYRGSGGPTLYHYPIDPTLYETYADELSVAENPFTTEFGLRIDPAKADLQAALLVPLVEGACGKNHVLLQQAWQAVINAGMNEEALAELCAPAMDEAAAYRLAERYRAADSQEAGAMAAEWAAHFNAKYKKVIELAKG